MTDIEKEQKENIIQTVDTMIGNLSENLLEKLFQNEVGADELRTYARELKNFSNLLLDDTMILQKFQNSESMGAYYEEKLRVAELTYCRLLDELEACQESNAQEAYKKELQERESSQQRRVLSDITNVALSQKKIRLSSKSDKALKARSDSIENYVSAEEVKKLHERLKNVDKKKAQLLSVKNSMAEVKTGLEDKLCIYRRKVQNLTAENEKVKMKLDEEANLNNAFFDRTHDVERNLKRKEEALLEMEMKFSELQKFNKMLYDEIQNKNDQLQTARNDLLDKNLEFNKVCDEKIKEIKRMNEALLNAWDRSLDMSGSVYSDQKAVEGSIRAIITPMQKNVLLLKNDQACLKAKMDKLSGKKLFEFPTPGPERTTKKRNMSGLQGTALVVPSSKKSIKHTAKLYPDESNRSHTSKESMVQFTNCPLEVDQCEITEGKINISFLTNDEPIADNTELFQTDREMSFEETLLNTIPRKKEKIIEEEEDRILDITEFTPQETKERRRRKESWKTSAKLQDSKDSVQVAKSIYGNEIQPLIKEILKENSTALKKKNNSKPISTDEEKAKCCGGCGLCNIF